MLEAFFVTQSFGECLINIANRGGESDTSGARAGMIAGSYYGLDSIASRRMALKYGKADI